jgi:hypothetical protein
MIHLGDRNKWVNSIKVDSIEIGFEDMSGLNWLWMGTSGWASVVVVLDFGFGENTEFHD